MSHLIRSLVSTLLLIFTFNNSIAAERFGIPQDFPGLSLENQNFMREILHNSRTIIDYTNQHVLNPHAPVSQDFLNLNDAHQTGSKQAVSFLREMMGLPYDIIPGFNDQSPFGDSEQRTREKVTEVFDDHSSGSDDEFLNMLDEAVAGISLKDPSPQSYLDNLYGLSGEAFVTETKEAITEALQQQGASTEEINTILGSRHITSLIHKSGEFNEQRRGLNVTVTLIGEEDTPSLAPNRVLTTGLKLCTEAANSFNEFAETYPTLASFSLTAMQVALGGPAGYVRNMAMHYTGAQEQVDGIVETSKAWVSNHLQEQMGMNPDHANLLTQGGGFGLTIGLTTIGGAKKEKVLQEAKNVADTAKRMIHKNSLEYKGPTHVYKITNPQGTYKIGESAQGLNKVGKSKRAEMQSSKLRKETGEYHETQVLVEMPGKSSARDVETKLIQSIRETEGTGALPGNKGIH